MRRKKLVGIYSIKCLINNREYIGSSKDISIRWNTHLIELIMGTHHNSGLQEDFNRYGITAFSFSIVVMVSSLKALKVVEQGEINKRKDPYNVRKAAVL